MELKICTVLPHGWLKTDLSCCLCKPISIDFSRSPLAWIRWRSVPESTIILSRALFRIRKMMQDEQMKGTASYGMLGRSSRTHHCSRSVLRDCIRSHRQRNGQGEEAAFMVFALIMLYGIADYTKDYFKSPSYIFLVGYELRRDLIVPAAEYCTGEQDMVCKQ